MKENSYFFIGKNYVFKTLIFLPNIKVPQYIFLIKNYKINIKLINTNRNYYIATIYFNKFPKKFT